MPTVQRAGSGATVTGIATLCGFSDLGRFAVRYRQLYGQPPLQTLRQAAQSVAPPLNRRTTSSPALQAAPPAVIAADAISLTRQPSLNRFHVRRSGFYRG
jgi:hypothetical protein